jgi:glycosyltransferase involved in cell wall biosynthesis
MKIAVWHNLPSGGGARALNYHLQGLLNQGHSIEIWSPNPLANGFIQLPDSVKTHTVPVYRTTHIPYKDRIRSVFFRKDINIRSMEAHCQQCANEINAGDFDVLFANSCFYYAVPFISRFVKIPTAVYLGEPFRLFFEAQPTSFWEAPTLLQPSFFSKNFWWEWIKDLWKKNNARVQLREERLNIEAIDTLLVNSIFSTESCARAYNRAGEVCYLGIDTQIFKPLPSRKIENYVIGLGNLFFHKNPELAIQALAKIKENRPRLVWVSNMKNANYVAQLQEMARNLSVEFEIKEMVTDEALVSLLNNALCMIYTSKLEPFGFAPLEANACKTPVVGLRQGGIRETIIDKKTGFLCTENADEIAEKIDFLNKNNEEREKMGQAALQNVLQNWTLDTATLRLENALQRTIQKNTNP